MVGHWDAQRQWVTDKESQRGCDVPTWNFRNRLLLFRYLLLAGNTRVLHWVGLIFRSLVCSDKPFKWTSCWSRIEKVMKCLHYRLRWILRSFFHLRTWPDVQKMTAVINCDSISRSKLAIKMRIQSISKHSSTLPAYNQNTAVIVTVAINLSNHCSEYISRMVHSSFNQAKYSIEYISQARVHNLRRLPFCKAPPKSRALISLQPSIYIFSLHHLHCRLSDCHASITWLIANHALCPNSVCICVEKR